MKKYLFSLLLSGLMASVSFGQAKVATTSKAKTKANANATAKVSANPAAENKASAEAKAPAAAFKWSELEHNFGTIPQSKPVTTTFKFTNTGKTPLIISQVQGSCGCTATDYSKEPIAPGKTGYVKATYNAAAAGAFHKTVTVTANTGEAPTVLIIKGEVKTEEVKKEEVKTEEKQK